MTYSFPCQDLSLAGKGKGMKKGTGTRSGLLWEVERLLIELKENLPQILLMENVPQVIGTKNIKDFNLWVQFLESKGYKNYIQVLNSKNYGIPQNRERCFMISLLGNYSYTFPKEKKLDKTLLDLLEPEPVDESYYLSDEQLKKIVWSDELKDNSILIKNATKKGYLEATEGDGIDISNRMETHRGTVQKGMTQTIKTQCENGVVVKDKLKLKKELCNILIEKEKVHEGEVIHHNYTNNKLDNESVEAKQTGLAPTIDTRCDCLGVCVKEKSDQIIKVGNATPSNHSAGDIISPKGIAPTVMENHGTITKIVIPLRIRKLTPLECWRLMGFDDEDYQKASKVNSKSQLYKQAGNSIVVNVLEAIFKQLL